MADSDSKPKQKHTKKKRKLKVPEDDRRPSKTQRFDFLEKEKEKDAKEERPIRRPEEGRPWGNLQLILSLQNKEILLQEKVQLAYDFVATRATEEEEDTEQGFETVSLSRVIIFLNDWIQSLLISSEKKSKVDLDKTQFQVVGTCLDFRCWEIFKFCLEESLERHVPLNISRNLLKAIHCIARNALSQLNDASLHAKESFFIVEGFELYGTVLSCVSLVFSSHNGLSNENLDLWISTVDAVLELVHKIYTDNIAGGNAGKFVLQFSCLVLEPFSKFLRVHPCRKNGFHDFVDKLLELLLHLLGVLNLQADGNNPGWTRDLLKLVEEVLSHGLFHPAHIDGFLSLHGKEKHGKEYDGQSEEPKMVVKSYHRHLFDKLEKIVAAKKVLPLSGIGELFHLLVVQVKKQKGALVLSEGTKIVGKTVGFIHSEDYFSGHMSMMFAGNHSVLSENSYLSSSLNSETRKSLFDFFVQIMEPLLFQIKGYLQTKLEVGPALLDVHCTLKSTNKLLASFMHEKVYVQTEDTHEGACLNFLKVVYDRIMSFSVEINQMWLSTVDADKGIHVDTLNLIGKELIAALGYFLEIDYEVIGNDLVSLWLMMLSFLAIGLSSMDMSDQSSLSSKMVDVGCQLINLYSELRQFVCRHIASRFCRNLEKSLSPLLSDAAYRDFDFNSSPNWQEVLSAFDNLSVVVSGAKYVTNDCASVAELTSHLSNRLPTEFNEEKKAFLLQSMEFTACQSSLNLLCWMPKGYLNSRSFSLYTTCILNLERFVVCRLIKCHCALCSHNHYELYRLFLSCRRTLKHLIMAFCEEKMEASQSSLTSIFPEVSFPVLWLLKSVSVMVGLQHTFSEDRASQFRYMSFSLMDQTSYVFLMFSKSQFSHVVHFSMNVKKSCAEQLNSDLVHEESHLTETDPCSDSSKAVDAWKNVVLVAEALKEQTENLLISLKDALCNKRVEVGTVDLNRLSSLVSCFQGFMWGLASAMNHIDVKECDDEMKLLKWKNEPFSKLNLCINVFTDFIDFSLCMFLIEDDQQPEGLGGAQNLSGLDQKNDCSLEPYGGENDISCANKQQKSKTARSSGSLHIDNDSENTGGQEMRLQLDSAVCATNFLSDVDLFELRRLNRPLLRSLLKGDNPEAAFFLRELFIASSAILRLNLQINCIPLSSCFVPIFNGISQLLLLELANMADVPQPISLVWLDGVLKYLEELGNQFPLTNPTLYRDVYAKLIDLHLKAIGKCISLQGKRATLASHDAESSTKTLDSHVGLSDASLSHGPYCFDEFKSRLRMSFKVFIKKPSELHLLSAIQALERALVGVQEGCMVIYDVNTGSAHGGKVSSITAAGIDCLDLVLEFVSGRKRLSVVKRHLKSLIAGLFNIVLHLQSPFIFYRKLIHNKGQTDPDPGSVILMCIEVLTRISGKHALFQMDPCHLQQCLRIPAALFQSFRGLRLSDAPASYNFFMFSDNQDNGSLESMDSCTVDRQFTIDLFAACCRLLNTVLKHHKSECEQCIALLEDSVCVLLRCLETVDADSVVRKGYFSWEVEEGVKCACFLRRIYEEMRQQKDVFRQHCFKFLSNYIWIYSGYGPLKTGIRREIDDALRPGVYALIDACSADDLQYLHTVFGEGPCRSTLATLQHDYKLNFQYEGKV
eukprot:XP_019074463.1 PREDICTED: uncharacterized protein LOC100248664 isoform X3 [Vitis vinifera]